MSGASGSGKTYVLNKALNSVDFGDCWCHTIDCRLFSDDKSACKEFLRQMNSPNSSDVLDVLRESGSGILIFDHFDSIKIIKSVAVFHAQTSLYVMPRGVLRTLPATSMTYLFPL